MNKPNSIRKFDIFNKEVKSMKKFRIVVTECDPFDYCTYTRSVVAYQDYNGSDILWYDSAYGIEQIAYASEHPEMVAC